VEYDGTAYHGFQYQPGVPTIQSELEKAIESLTGERTRIAGAGRTDAGVHARGQVAAFDTRSSHSPEVVVNALNHFLPEDIVVKEAHRVDAGFDPRRNALSRRYRYTIHNSRRPAAIGRNTRCHVAERLDLTAMCETVDLFVGTHDFDRFSGPLPNGKTNTVRTVTEAVVAATGPEVTFEVTANAFLPHQVRRMTGALVDVGRGRLTIEDVKNMIEMESTDAVAHTMAAKGLCLMEVKYHGFPPRNGECDGSLR